MSKEAYENYADVPWYRKNGNVMGIYVLFPPAGIYFYFTGAYKEKDGKLENLGTAHKVVSVLLLVGLIFAKTHH